MCEICKRLFYSRELLDQHASSHATPTKAHPTDITSQPTGVIMYPTNNEEPISTLSHPTPVVLSAYSIAHLNTNSEHLNPTSSPPTTTNKVCPTTAKTSPNKCQEKTFVNTSSAKERQMVASSPNDRERKFAPLLQPKGNRRAEKSVCGECGKLVNKCYMKNHMLIHGGKKEFECKICKKKFTHKTTLLNHNTVHTGKKFECLECGKAFSRKSYLTFHTKIHLDEAYRKSRNEPL